MRYYEEDILKAYKALKSNTYWDKSNTNLNLRKKIADFEKKYFKDGSFRYNRFIDAVTKRDIEFFDEYFKEIDLIITPKKLKQNENKEIQIPNYISNNTKKYLCEIERLYIFIDCPIELHILNIIWIYYFGYKIDKRLSKCCYGNRLNFTKKDKKLNEKNLFKPYYGQYKDWRDESLKAAKFIIEDQNDDAVILTLDIKDYYYSIAIDTSELESHLKSLEEFKEDDKEENAYKEFLNEMFLKTHFKYTELLKNLNYPKENNICKIKDGEYFSIPIGLLSSPIMANLYLDGFDKIVEGKIKPYYYGRYVDDMIFVFRNPGQYNPVFWCKETNCIKKEFYEEGNLNDIDCFLINHLYECVVIKKTEDNHKSNDNSKSSNSYIIRNNPQKLNEKDLPKLIVQQSKVFLYEFKKDQPLSVLEKLKKDIEISSSEFRFTTEEYPVSFDDKAYELIYDGSSRKIITLKDYKINKYGLSVFMAKKLNRIMHYKEESDNDFKAINLFFQGENIINHSNQWERLFTYYTLLGNVEEILVFLLKAKNEIDKLIFKENKEIEKKIRISLKFKLYYSFITAISLNPNLFYNAEKNRDFLLMFDEIKNVNDKKEEMVKKDIDSLRMSNLLRHNFIAIPLYNYTKKYYNDKSLNLIISKKNTFDKMIEDFSIAENLVKLSPRSIRNYEISIAELFQNFYKNSDQNSNEKLNNNLNDIFFKEKEEKTFLKKDDILTPSITFNSENDAFIEEFDFSKYYPSQDKLKIAVANFHINENDFKRKLKKEYKLKKDRFEKINKVLDEAERYNSDIVIFPEWAIPAEMLPYISRYSMQHERVVIFGMDYIISDNIAHNFCGIVLPIKDKNREFKDAVFIPRLKNHYAPSEIEMILGFHLSDPHNYYGKKNHKLYSAKDIELDVSYFSDNRYNLIKFKGCRFSVFYCFEFADISHRSLLKGEIDLLFVPEYNKDTHYFSNIVESSARDIHCFIAQCNSAQFGDTRIIQPAKKEYNRDIVKIKGGDNNTVLLGEINIKKLHEFQIKAYNLQMKDTEFFKPVPPNFNNIKNTLKCTKIEWNK